jgi:hypothetical protein
MPDNLILQAAQAELRKHGWDTFVDEPPSMAQGGKGIVTPGCPHCRKKLYTTNQFIEHIANDVLPGIIEAVLRSFAS